MRIIFSEALVQRVELKQIVSIGTLEIKKTSLVSLAGFATLSHVDELLIKDNRKLEDLRGLEGIVLN